jgi:hypothetical protein
MSNNRRHSDLTSTSTFTRKNIAVGSGTEVVTSASFGAGAGAVPNHDNACSSGQNVTTTVIEEVGYFSLLTDFLLPPKKNNSQNVCRTPPTSSHRHNKRVLPDKKSKKTTTPTKSISCGNDIESGDFVPASSSSGRHNAIAIMTACAETSQAILGKTEVFASQCCKRHGF